MRGKDAPKETSKKHHYKISFSSEAALHYNKNLFFNKHFTAAPGCDKTW